MQIRCSHCTKTIALAASGELPSSCPHCTRVPGPGPLGPYEPIRLIAAGGMGEVYLARHRELGTEVAVKVLPAMPLDAIAAVRERFLREARLTASVQHPGIVKVHGDDVAGDRPYLVLEYVAGQTLRQRLQAGPLPVVAAARIAAAVADVLAAAHAQGVLHRDIKPDNVMLDDHGAVRVLDFGIARAVQDDAPITRTGEIVGTPEYMAPEQLLDGPDAITERTDVHALGVLLYELLTGRSPFHGANVFQALKLVESLVPPPPSHSRPDVPEALDAVLARALEKNPDDRLSTAQAFAAAVRDAVPAARSTPPPRRSRSLLYVWLPLAGVLAAAAIVVAALLHALGQGLAQLPAAIGAAISSSVREFVDTATLEAWLHSGHWQRTHWAALHARDAGDPSLQRQGRQAFVFSQLAWPLAAGAPPWLAASAESLRARWFGDGLEPATTADAEAAPWLATLVGDFDDAVPAADAPRSEWRRHLLQRYLATDDPALLLPLHADTHLLDDALSRLLRIRLLPTAERAAAFGDYARRLPFDSPEYWLARLVERHLGGDHSGGTQAAEMAWLSGAGELAVLLDAWLACREPDAARPWRPMSAAEFAQRRRRVAAAADDDAPAGALLVALLDTVRGAEIDLRPARRWPSNGRAAASRWFVAAAGHDPDQCGALLLFATALGATPTYSEVPWHDTATPWRERIDSEVRRGR